MSELYKLTKQQLVTLAKGDDIFSTLTEHALLSAGNNKRRSIEGMIPVTLEQYNKPSLLFPDTFYVKWTAVEGVDDTDDTNGLRYYRSLKDKEPFLIMGWCDNGYVVVHMLLRCM